MDSNDEDERAVTLPAEEPSTERLDPPTLTASGPTPVFVRGLADTLPYNALSWENFERLLHRVARQVRGWNDVHTYGKRGQKQFGIDVVGRQADSTRATIQSKKYESFDEADLTAALDKFDPDGLPVKNVQRLVVATAHEASRRQIVDVLSARQDDLERSGSPIELEFWNAGTLDEMLRDRADIVTEFFGGGAAEEFCGYRPPITPPPTPQHAAIAEMVMVGPTSEPAVAGALQRAAELTDARQFSEAADAFAEAKALLRNNGFMAHASLVDKEHSEALVAAGRRAEAALIAAHAFWDAAETADFDTAASARHRLEELSTPTEDGAGPDDVTLVLSDTAGLGYAVMRQPVGTVADAVGNADFEVLVDRAAVDPDALDVAARMLTFLGETAGSQPLDDWTTHHEDLLRGILVRLGSDGSDPSRTSVRRRLEMTLASVDGWEDLLSTAARRRMTRPERTTVHGRAALAAADRGAFDDADLLWLEAVEGACLDGHNDDAAEWVFARRNVKQATAGNDFRAFEGVVEDQRLTVALRHIGGGLRQPVIRRAAAEAAEAASDDKQLLAVLAGRAYLRLAFVNGSWRQVSHAASSLSRAYAASGEPLTALQFLVAAGMSAEAAALVKSHEQTFLDVTAFLDDPSPLVVRAALRSLASQADLIPDALVEPVVNVALRLLEDAVAAGALQPVEHARYLAALDVLAALASRVDHAIASQLFEIFVPGLDREPGQRYTTDEVALRILDGIGRGHSDLTTDVAERVVQFMLVDDDCARTVRKCATGVLRLAVDTVVPVLREAATDAGSSAAATMLAVLGPRAGLDPDSEAVANARQRLLEEPDLVEGVGYMGTGAVSDSLLLVDLPTEERQQAIAALLRRVEEEPTIKSMSWPDYLVAAFNLAYDVGPAPALFERALAIAESALQPPAEALFDNSPLSAVQTSGFRRDVRPTAVALAARLATTAEEREAAQRQCMSMLPWHGEDGDHLVLAFQALPDIQDVSLLVSQGAPHLRALAAHVWARAGGLDVALGNSLARDPELTVRHALATALAAAAAEGPLGPMAATVAATLKDDPSYTVRSALRDV